MQNLYAIYKPAAETDGQKTFVFAALVRQIFQVMFYKLHSFCDEIKNTKKKTKKKQIDSKIDKMFHNLFAN